MVTAGRYAIGVLLVVALGMAVVTVRQPAMALDPSLPAAPEPPREQVVITATKPDDAVLTAKVEKALNDDPYIFADHVTVTAKDGVVRLQGIVFGVQDLRRMLVLARRIAGKRRVINELELVIADDNGTG
jgi:hypothetical protein